MNVIHARDDEALNAARAVRDPATGGVELSVGDSTRVLHPLWLRERAEVDGAFDPNNWQRLYEPCLLDEGLTVAAVEQSAQDALTLTFSDGARGALSLSALGRELGWLTDPCEPPRAEPWTAATRPQPEACWADLDDPGVLTRVVGDFLRHGFCVLRDTPTARDSLQGLAERFGYVRDTHFGKLFNVVTKPNPNDLAYTGRRLPGHTDNPYRTPIPGIQLLHCLTNSVEGGLSTLADGFAIARRIQHEDPAMFRVLTTTPVRFRYQADTIMQAHGPLIETDDEGELLRVRFSTRLDYVPARDAETLDDYYRGRRRFYELAHDPEFQITNTFEPGMLIMFDNQRLLHGRGEFDQTSGHRHLQGCYIDHDGPDSLYRLLMRDGREPTRQPQD